MRPRDRARDRCAGDDAAGDRDGGEHDTAADGDANTDRDHDAEQHRDASTICVSRVRGAERIADTDPDGDANARLGRNTGALLVRGRAIAALAADERDSASPRRE